MYCWITEEWECKRPYACHLCGGFPDKRYHQPYWVVVSLWSDPIPDIEKPTQQLCLFEPPQIIVWWKHYGCTPKLERQWYGAAYHCQRGADWAIANERELGAYDVRVAMIKLKPGCKRKRIAVPYQFCDK